MTRDECLGAASAAFGGAFAWAKRGYWQIKIETQPMRTIVLSRDFVQKNIFENEMIPDDFLRIIQEIPAEHWSTDEDGGFFYLMR